MSTATNRLQARLPFATDTKWLFPAKRGRTGHTTNLDKPFRRVVTAAGLDTRQVARHTLRHTAITHMAEAGIDLPTVKRISGHRNLSLVERYSHHQRLARVCWLSVRVNYDRVLRWRGPDLGMLERWKHRCGIEEPRS